MYMLARYLLTTAVVAAMSAPLLGQEIHRDSEGIRVEPVEVPADLVNNWPAEEEKAFWQRANAILKAMTSNADGSPRKVDARTFFESEKWSYPSAFAAILVGRTEPGLKVLQAEDADAGRWHQHTEGIDFFPAFTLKGQMRKYFFFGNMLAPEYRQRMRSGAANWTRTDPRNTPHPIFQKFNSKVEGWTPERFGNKQADSRNTDNLRAMRDIAIYLFAQETRNTETMDAAARDIKWYVDSLYSVGMGEWDSETYHPHSVAAYLNLYDFAQDDAMRGVAKAALDHMFTAAALKYFYGTHAGASKRDYGHSYKPAGGAFTKFFPLYFGQVPRPEIATEWDVLHAITSAYRPPAAVLALARKEFERPVEVLATHPTYEHWKPGGSDKPRNFETIHIGRTFQMASVVSTSAENDLAPFRLSAASAERGADVFAASSKPKLNEKFAGDQIGQYRNLLVWLRPGNEKEPFAFLLPSGAKLEQQSDVWFAQVGDGTYLAIRPIGLAAPAPAPADSEAAKHIAKIYPQATLYLAPAVEGAYIGFAMEVGEAPQHDSLAAFQQAVLSSGKLDLSGAGNGRIRLTGSDGAFVELTHEATNDLPKLSRNGTVRDWNDPANWRLYHTVNGGDKPLIELGWKERTLRVNAGGHSFQATLSPEGQATFEQH
jgi:hypothetical protein